MFDEFEEIGDYEGVERQNQQVPKNEKVPKNKNQLNEEINEIDDF